MGGDPGNIGCYLLVTKKTFGRLTIAFKTLQRDFFYLIVLVQLPLPGGLPGDDQVLVIVLGVAELGKQDQ
jgi:hypothetical protein